jgi:Na+-transporting NADH:ubiquinone oxidoreductase subunit C
VAEPAAASRPASAASEPESALRALVTVLLVSLVGSALVTAAVTMLRPIQERRALVELTRGRVLAGAGLAGAGAEAELWSRVETRIVDLESGAAVEAEAPEAFDFRSAARDPATSVEIPSELDVAEIGRRARRMPVYIVRKPDGSPDSLVFPVYGEGLYSTLYGYLSLEPDLRTVRHISFYEHGETPGLGGDIENAEWQAGWRGKQVFDDAGEPVIEVTVDGAEGPHQVDGITGATLTGDGVTGLVRYWMGEHGYGPTLARLREDLR